jgi:hypothetical protein
VSKAETDRALRVAQEQEQVLRRLEREIARSKDYLQKVTFHSSVGRRDDFMGLLGGAESGRRHILELAQHRRRFAGGVAEQPLGRRGVLKGGQGIGP